ncbi:MAG: PBECR2 nuclease fold domain-containing protein [Bacillota bacterium]
MSVKDFKGDEVVLTNYVFSMHVYSSKKSEADREARLRALDLVPEVLQKPRYVYYNYDDPAATRRRYIDLVEFAGKIKALVVVVDASTRPEEVVSWQVKSNLKQEKIERGGIIYNGKAITPESKI